MKLAYADPPYLGNGHRVKSGIYKGHPDDAGPVDHELLLGRLREYDGWALSASSPSLGFVLSLSPPGVRVGAWCKTWSANRPWAGARYSWEPVIFSPARRSHRAIVRDWMLSSPQMGADLIGQKPPEFCRWVFHLLGAEPEDEFDDLFRGSGAVARAWEKFQAQGQLSLSSPSRELEERGK